MDRLKLIFKNSIITVFFTLLSRLTGFVRDMVFAFFLGSGKEGDIFFAAFRIPNMFRRIFGEGAMASVFIPIFSRRFERDKKSAIAFAYRILFLLLISLTILAIAMIWFMPEIISFSSEGFHKDPEKFATTIYIAKILSPFVIFICLGAILASMLMSAGNFFYHTSISVIFNIFLIVTVIILFKTTSYSALKIFTFSVLIAGIVQFSFPIIGLFRNKLLPIKNTKPHPEDTKTFFVRFLPAVLSSGIYQINVFVDSIFASFFAGATAFLYYTDRIGQLPLSLIGHTIGTVLLPSLSKKLTLDEQGEIQQKTVNFSLVLSIPCVFAVMLLSEEIVRFVFQRGAFDHSSVQIVAKMLIIYMTTMPLNVINKIFNSYLMSKGLVKINFIASIISIITNITTNLLLYKTAVGMYCVVISMSASSIANFLCLFFACMYSKNFFLKLETLFLTIKLCILSYFVIFASQKIITLIFKANNNFTFLLLSLFSGIFYISLLPIFRVIKLQEVKKFLKK